MTEYIVRYTDPTTTPIIVEENTVVRDVVDVPLIGRIFQRYGEDVNVALLNVLENFACPEASGATSEWDAVPDLDEVSITQLHNPVVGQFWFNSSREMIYYHDGTVWVPVPTRGLHGANWGRIASGNQIPRPVNAHGYTFPYEECIWSVSPASMPGPIDTFNCDTDENAFVTMEYRYAKTTEMIDGIANYLIIGIPGNVNNGVGHGVTPFVPSPTPTPTLTSTPEPTATLTPSPTPTATGTMTPTPTVTSTVTPTLTPTVTMTRTRTPTPTPTRVPSPTPTKSPPVLVPAGLPASLGGGCYGTSGGNTFNSYFIQFEPNGNIYEKNPNPFGPSQLLRGNWRGSYPNPWNVEVQFTGSSPTGKTSGAWYNLGNIQSFDWEITSVGAIKPVSKVILGSFRLRLVGASTHFSECPLEVTQLMINMECF